MSDMNLFTKLMISMEQKLKVLGTILLFSIGTSLLSFALANALSGSVRLIVNEV